MRKTADQSSQSGPTLQQGDQRTTTAGQKQDMGSGARQERSASGQRIIGSDRIAKASRIELIFLSLIVSGFLTSRYYMFYIDSPFIDSPFFEIQRALVLMFSDPFTLFVASLYFLDYFAFILNGKTIIVALLATPTPEGVAVKQKSELSIPASPRSIPKLRDADRVTEVEEPEASKDDEVEAAFIQFTERSRETVRSAQRRPNALLFVGTVIALIGLIFFIITLPGFITPTNSSLEVTASDLSRRLLDLTPRLLMLVFIQLLAGFFLRQYRGAMEELRYYESILRYREVQFLSYLLRRNQGVKSGIEKFAADLLNNRESMKLQRGETTLVLEAHKSESNEFRGLIESVLDLLKTNRAGGRADKEQA